MTTFTRFVDSGNHYMLNITSEYWVLYSPTGDLVISGGVCLGPSTKNLVEYHAVIGLLMESIANNVREIKVYLDS